MVAIISGNDFIVSDKTSKALLPSSDTISRIKLSKQFSTSFPKNIFFLTSGLIECPKLAIPGRSDGHFFHKTPSKVGPSFSPKISFFIHDGSLINYLK